MWNRIKEVVRKMLTSRNISSAIGIKLPEIAQSERMRAAIQEWHDMYSGHAPWIDGSDVVSLRLEQGIVRELANVALNEMTTSVTLPKLDAIYQKTVERLNIELQKGLMSGAMVIKPLGADKVQFLPQTRFIPIGFDIDGMMTKVIFPDTRPMGTDKVTRLEYHSLDDKTGLTITNRAFMGDINRLGREVMLDVLPEWAGLPPSVSYPLMHHPAYGYYVNPIDNTIDGSACGMSYLEPVKHLIRLADLQAARLDWEYRSGERAVYIDEAAIRRDGKIDALSKRLYRKVDMDAVFDVSSPDIRQVPYSAGLEEYKRAIEFAVGLSYGDISNPQEVEKTATEILSAKKRKYNTVMAIQRNLKTCLEGFVFALAFFNGAATQKYDFVCDFRDSILTDDDTERQQDIQMVSMGVMRPEEFRAKWMGEPIDVALKNLPQSAQVLE